MVEFLGVKFFSVKETAEKLNLSESVIRHHIRNNNLTATEFGGKYMIPEYAIEELKKLLKEKKEKKKPTPKLKTQDRKEIIRKLFTKKRKSRKKEYEIERRFW